MPPEIVYQIETSHKELPGTLVIRVEVVDHIKPVLTNTSSSKNYSKEQLMKLATESDKEALKDLCLIVAKQSRMTHKAEHYDYIVVPNKGSLELLKTLAATGKLYSDNKKLVCDFFKPAPLKCILNLIQRDPLVFEIKGCLELRQGDVALDDCHYLGKGESPWFIQGMLLRTLSDDLQWEWLEVLLSVEARKWDQSKVERYLEQYEDEKESIGYQLIISEDAERFLHAAPQILPKLILKDRVGASADLWIQYSPNESIALHDPSSAIQDRQGKVRFRRQRDKELEWEKDLLETDYTKKLVGNSHYYCPVNKVGKSLAFLLEIGWTIFDFQGNRVWHPQLAQLSFKADSGNITAVGEVDYAEFKADLKSVVGAFNRREAFVNLSPGHVGLLPEWSTQQVGELAAGEFTEKGIRLKKNRFAILQQWSQGHAKITEDLEIAQLRQGLIEFKGLEEILPLENFQAKLRSYQQEGVNWLHFLKKFGFQGILADDMGLGKTVQVLAFLSRAQTEEEIALIVVPTSLIFNWKREFEKFLPSHKILIHHGPSRYSKIEGFKGYNIVLTSYTTLRIDLPLFKKLAFTYIILDEAQAIKNPETQIAQAVCEIEAPFRLSITGTPIENSIQDLWSQFHFLMPDLLESREEFLAQAQAAMSDSRYTQQIKQRVKPFILRRRKQDVAKDLPAKLEQEILVPMEDSQQRLYEQLLTTARNKLLVKEGEHGVTQQRMAVLEAILRLRQICCHPKLAMSVLQEEDSEVMEDFVSAKFNRICEDIVTVVEEGRKVLVYSQFTQFLKLIGAELVHLKLPYAYLDGQTANREEVVQRFQTDPEIKIFLISLKAGGVGLNLTAAEYVFICDPWWNVAAENQAIDRAHRIGQQHTVIARRYITMESIEEKILKLKQAKVGLAEDIIDEAGEGKGLTFADLQFLLK
ncbi:MAG: rapA [Chlamydiales bacterium]|jgi:hypothetical protein|nr:rapA [Chlamydiales bacterium]